MSNWIVVRHVCCETDVKKSFHARCARGLITAFLCFLTKERKSVIIKVFNSIYGFIKFTCAAIDREAGESFAQMFIFQT